MQLIPYTTERKTMWDCFVKQSRNATFLFYRDYMEYHQSRFEDGSLLFLNERGTCCGLLPCNLLPHEATIVSHGGLTYGGLLLAKKTTAVEVRDMLKSTADYYIAKGYKQLIYKPIPYIYHRYATQEDLYWLFRAKGQLISRALSSTICLTDPLAFSELRRRKVKKAYKNALAMHEGDEQMLVDFWNLLTATLKSYHQVAPVHSIDEILYLKRLFPKEVSAFCIYEGEQLVAGTLLFITGHTVHVQYIAASERGRMEGALDFLFDQLIEKYRNEGKTYFDFGISTEQQGAILNQGLLFQKEGFGGRGVCYDAYSVELKNLCTYLS